MRVLAIICWLMLASTSHAAVKVKDYTNYSYERASNKFESLLSRQVKRRGAQRFELSFTLPTGENAMVAITAPVDITPLLDSLAGSDYSFSVKAFRDEKVYKKFLVLLNKPVVETDPVIELDPVIVTDPVVENDPVVPEESVFETDPVTDPIVEAGPVVETDPTIETDPVQEPAPVLANRSLTLSWTIPTSRENGVPLTMEQIAGYEIYFIGDTEASQPVDEVIAVNDGLLNSYTIDEVGAGIYYFSIASEDTDGVKSEPSEIISVTVQ